MEQPGRAFRVFECLAAFILMMFALTLEQCYSDDGDRYQTGGSADALDFFYWLQEAFPFPVIVWHACMNGQDGTAMTLFMSPGLWLWMSPSSWQYSFVHIYQKVLLIVST